MENQQNPMAQPPFEPLKQKHISPKIWVPALVVVALAVTYLGVASAYDVWPFSHVSPPAKDEIEGDEERVDELAKWQTYRNEEFGFEVKYPPKHLIGEYPGRDNSFYATVLYEVNSPDPSRWGIEIFDRKFKSIEEVIANIGSQFSDRKETRENTIINGVNAIKVVVTTPAIDDWVAINIIFEKGDRIYNVGNGATQDSEFATFYKSFKFIESEIDTSGWKIYKNEEFGFEVKYPKEWIEEDGFLYSQEMYNAREGGPYSLLISVLDRRNELPSQDCIRGFEKYDINNIPAERYTDICSFGKPTYFILKIREKNILGTSYSFNKLENVIIYDILSTFKFIEPNSSNPITTPNAISWETALDFIRGCKVSTVFQYHDLRANLNLIDGRKITTIQPQIDLVISEAESASQKCGYTIPVATE